MLRPDVRCLSGNAYRAINGTPKSLCDFSHKTYEVADSLLNSLLASSDLLPIQWAARLRPRLN